MCVLLGIFGFLFLCSLDGKCRPFYCLSHFSKDTKSCRVNFKIATFVLLEEKVARVHTEKNEFKLYLLGYLLEQYL